MILQALIAYAERENLGDADFEERKVHWLIPVTLGGKLAGPPIPLYADPSAKKPQPQKLKCPFTEQSQLTNSHDPRSHFLCDSLERAVAMPNPKATNDRRALQHAYFKNLLNQAAASCPINAAKIGAVVQMLDDPQELAKLHGTLTGLKAKPTENTTFQVNGDMLLDIPEIQTFWRNRRLKVQANDSKPLRVCLATGVLTETVDTTQKIKGVPGGLAVGTSLISFDKAAFTSYNLDQAQNAAISVPAELKSRAALNDLISKGLRFKDQNTVHVHWTRQKEANDPFDILSSADEQAIANLLQAPITGFTPLAAEENTYYAMSLSANGGRIIVRDWLESTVPEINHNIKQWFQDLAIIKPDGEANKYDFKLGALLYAMVREDLSNLAPQIPSQLIECALKNQPLPQNILAAAIHRQQLDQEEKTNPWRIALIKACLLRSSKTTDHHQPNQKTMTESLNLECKDPGYLCGRLFAVFDRLQYLAQGSVNSGVVERFYASASATPALVMGRLFRNAQFHLAKADPGVSANVSKDLEAVVALLGNEFPTSLSLEGQGQFALGYYHQKADYRRRSAERKEKTAETTQENQ